MQHLAIALAVVGIAASISYCTIQVRGTDADERRFEAEQCERLNGRMVRDWGVLVCQYPEGRS
jgi:hypothetical protein